MVNYQLNMKKIALINNNSLQFFFFSLTLQWFIMVLCFPSCFFKEETSVFTLLAYLLFCIVFVFPRTIYFLCIFLACTWHIIIYLGFFQWVAEVKVWRHEEEATFGDLTGHLVKGNWYIDKKRADQSTQSDQYHLE